MFDQLPIILQNEAKAVLESIVAETSHLADLKELDQLPRWIRPSELPEEERDKLLLGIARCIEFCQSESINFQLYLSFTLRIASMNGLDVLDETLNHLHVKEPFSAFYDTCEGDEIEMGAALALYDLYLDSEKQINGVVIDPIIRFNWNVKGRKCPVFEDLIPILRYCKRAKIDIRWWVKERIRRFNGGVRQDGKAIPWNLDTFVNDMASITFKDYEAYLEQERKLKARLDATPWRDVIQYLGLSPDVKFVDGSIPKGFDMATEHLAQGGEMKEILSINQEGYYFVAGGARYRGRRHHEVKEKHIISCTPDTFGEMKEGWWNAKLRLCPARTEELANHGLHKGEVI